MVARGERRPAFVMQVGDGERDAGDLHNESTPDRPNALTGAGPDRNARTDWMIPILRGSGVAPTHQATSASADRGRVTLYVVVWAVMALSALAYLALLTLRPDIASRMIFEPPFGTPEGNQGQRAMFRALAEIQDLKQKASRLQTELADVRAAAEADRRMLNAVELRLQALERRQAETTPVADATAATNDDAAAKARREPRQQPPKIAASTTAAPLREASAFETQALPAPRPAPVAIVLTTGASLDAIRLSWQLLQESHRSALKGLEPRAVEAASDPASYQLLAGPIASREAAAKVCERLKAKQAPCSIAPMAGQPL